jgi:cell wall assembly regulator SMI1
LRLVRKNLVVVPVLLAAVVLILILAVPPMQSSFLYPKPQGLPPIVDQPTEQLLARLQAVLETNAPLVAQSLKPGLSDAEIVALESEGGFHLSEDLRSLYHWHNGTSTNSTDGLLPGHRFLPLGEAARERTLLAQQVDSASLAQRVAFAVFAGHRKGWVQVLDDGAGDGYFYDPERFEADGAFFYHMAEAGYYVWFPSLRNFLAGAIECYESGAIKVATHDHGLIEDYDQTQKIWERFGKSSEVGK